MARILVMSPSGEVYDHDCVRWYDYRNIAASLEHYHNIGDAFVYDSSLKLLDFEALEVVDMRLAHVADVDRLNAEFDYVLLRGSNYIHQDFDWLDTIEILKKLKLPVLALGIGAQAPVKGELVLSEQMKTVLRMIGDSTASIGVRGAFSAQVLNDIGIKNTRIVACPTAFRRNDPNLAIRLPPLDHVRSMGVTLRREVSPVYARDIRQYLTFHRDLITMLADRFEVVLMAQGEVEEKKLVFGTPDQKEEGMAALKANDWARQWYLNDTVEELYRNRLFYSDVVADYEDLVQQKDAVLGYRLHGNLMALANGTPSIYFTYDSRTAEFAETLKIPSFDVFSGKPFDLEAAWQQPAFDGFNRAFRAVYRDMYAFLRENKIPIRMTPPADAQQSEQPRKVA